METCLETSLGNTRRKSAVSLLQRLLQRLGKCGVSLFTDLFTPPRCLPWAKNARFHGYRLGYLATFWLPFATWAGSGAAWVRLQVSHRCRKNFLLLRPCVGVRPQCKRKPGAVAGCWVVPLWSRCPVPADASGASGFVGQSPEAGETTPTVSGQSGIASVIAPPKPTDTGPGGSGALGARRAQRVNCR